MTITESPKAHQHWRRTIPLILLWGAISLSPSFFIRGGISEAAGKLVEIRIEDILMLVFGTAWLLSLFLKGESKIKMIPLLAPIFAWIGFSLFGTLINILLGNLNPLRVFFFFVKELQFFFIYFYVFCHLNTLKEDMTVVKAAVFFIIPNMLWIALQTFTPIRFYGYYYGAVLYSDPGNPAGSGMVFLMLFIFLFHLFLYYHLKVKNKKKIHLLLLFILYTSPILGVFTSGTHTALLGLMFTLLLTTILYVLKTQRFSSLLKMTLIFVLASISFFMLLRTGEEGPTQRQAKIFSKVAYELSPNKPESRIKIWRSQLSELGKFPLYPFIGLGKSSVGEAHNHYIRIAVESGLIGLILFLLLIGVILKISLNTFLRAKEPFLVAISAGLFVITCMILFASITAETITYTVKTSETYWFLTGLAMAVIYHSKNKT